MLNGGSQIGGASLRTNPCLNLSSLLSGCQNIALNLISLRLIVIFNLFMSSKKKNKNAFMVEAFPTGENP